MQVTNIRVSYSRKRQPAQYESSGADVEFVAVLDATLGDSQDHKAAAIALLGDAKTIVLTELGLVAAGKSASAHALAPAEAGQVSSATATSSTPSTATATAQTTAPEGGKGKGRRKTDNTPPATASNAAPAADTAPPANAGTAAGIPDEGAATTSKPAETSLGRTLPAQPEQKPAAAAGIPVDDTPPANSNAAPATTTATATTAPAATNGSGDLTPAAVQKYITQCLVQKKFLPNVVLGVLKNDFKVDRVFDLEGAKLAEFYAKIKSLAGETA